MDRKSSRIIFHIDVNSAFLSWTALDLLNNKKLNYDIRKIPSIVGGSLEERRGVVLAKSIPAKKFDIQTGEPIVSALKKCPTLEIYSPDFSVYRKFSRQMYELLTDYSNTIERYSIDEVFIDMSAYGNDYMEKAREIKERIISEIGFTVNIGISENKLLAKMAGDFPKKNSIYTLFKDEIQKKMWPLPVGRLLMVGKSAEKRLQDLNIMTIGDLANYNLPILRNLFKSYADVIYNYANGIDNSEIDLKRHEDVKGIGNATTLSQDVADRDKALKILLSITETVAARLRKSEMLCNMTAVSIRTSNFIDYSHQRTFKNATHSTSEIFKQVIKIFDEMWMGEPIRQLGVRVGKLSDNRAYQSSIFDSFDSDKMNELDKTIDELRNKYGSSAVVRMSSLKDTEESKIDEKGNPWL